MKKLLTTLAIAALLLTGCGAPEKDATYEDANALAEAYEKAVDGVKCDRTESNPYTHGWHSVICDNDGSVQVYTDLDKKMVVINRNPIDEGERRLYAANWMIFDDKEKIEAAQKVLGGKISGGY